MDSFEVDEQRARLTTLKETLEEQLDRANEQLKELGKPKQKEAPKKHK